MQRGLDRTLHLILRNHRHATDAVLSFEANQDLQTPKRRKKLGQAHWILTVRFISLRYSVVHFMYCLVLISVLPPFYVQGNDTSMS